MKLILEIDDTTLKNIQGFCDTQQISIGQLIESLFNRYIQEPTDIIDDIYKRCGDLKELEDFKGVLTYYLSEVIYDIEEIANSDEAYPMDNDMVRVFKSLSGDLVTEPYQLTRLYNVYRRNKS